MTSQFSPRVSEILSYSREEAIRLSSLKVRPEHLLMGIIRERSNETRILFDHFLIDMLSLKNELEDKVRIEPFTATTNS